MIKEELGVFIKNHYKTMSYHTLAAFTGLTAYRVKKYCQENNLGTFKNPKQETKPKPQHFETQKVENINHVPHYLKRNYRPFEFI